MMGGADPQTGILVAALLLGSLALMVCGVQCCTCKRRRDGEMETPLLDETERRKDVAIRQAKDGFNECAACGFQNFKRMTKCCICSRAIDSSASLHGVCAGSDETLQQLSLRQQRARWRREWQRKIDIRGDAFWYREAPEANAQLWPGYVVRWRRDEANEAPKSSPSHSRPCTSEETAQALQLEYEASAFDITAAAQADSWESTFDDAHAAATGMSVRDIVHIAAKDFPSKYAIFVEQAANLQIPPHRAHFCLHLDRAQVYQDTIEALCAVRKSEIRAAIRVMFAEENGIDAGALHREWLDLIMHQLVAPETGLFQCMDEQTFVINPQSQDVIGEDYLAHFFVVGRLLGRALMEGNATGFHLALPLLKTILGIPVSFGDLQYVDHELYRNLLWLLEHPDVDQLGLDFSIARRHGDTWRVIDLVPNGHDIQVTDENKTLLVDRHLQFVLFEEVAPQLFAMLRGIHEVIPPQLLMLLDPEELDVMLGGTADIDVDDWQCHAIVPEEPDQRHIVSWFWDVVRGMSEENRRRLLLFCTGSSQLPLAGFAALTSYDGHLCPFTLQISEARVCADGYVASHACFNRLDIPRCATRDELKRVLEVTLSTDLYGFTTY